MLKKEIEARLATVVDPYLEMDLVKAKVVKHIEIDLETIDIELCYGYPIAREYEALKTKLQELLSPIIGQRTLSINIHTQIDSHVGRHGVQGYPHVKNIIAVASGKGGVGKSTIAVNLALALARDGASVGLLDADIYGPSQPAMVGARQEQSVIKDGALMPIMRHGIQTMSMGYLINEDTPMVWRGPMIGKAMQQLLHDTKWEPLDYLIIDLPPGTGDIQLTLCQKIPVSGAVMVTTPQDLALLDVRRACAMFHKLDVPILGVVENMAAGACPHCGHEEAVFGVGGGHKLAREHAVAMLGSIPLAAAIRECTDNGNPAVIAHPSEHIAQTFFAIARQLAAKLSLQMKDYSAKFPKIVVK